MKVFVTGVGGQLGHDVMNELAARGHQGVGSDRAPEYKGVQDGSAVTTMPYVSMDITDKEAVGKIIQEVKPDAIVHCAAWTAVDAAEDQDKQETVWSVNVEGTRNIADAAKSVDAKMMYFSTDYVFDGQGEAPWDPDSKEYAPINFYGKSKLGGELAVSEILEKYFIVRIAWVFGVNGNNFIKTMLKVGQSHDEVRVVCDQIGTPTYTLDLAKLVVDMIETEKYGYYHATNSELPEADGSSEKPETAREAADCSTKTGYISWYDFTREIYHQAGLTTKITPVTTEEYGLSKAARPANSRLDKSKLEKNGFSPLPTWPDAVARYLKILKEQEVF